MISSVKPAVRGFSGGFPVVSKGLIKDINEVQWPANPSVLFTNRLTADGKLMDLSGNGNHGTITGATRKEHGPWGAYYYFDGTDDKITISDAPLLRPTTAVTFMALFSNPNPGDAQDHMLISKGNHLGSTGFEFGFGWGNDLYLIASDGSTYHNTDAATISASAFHLLLGTFDGNNLIAYDNNSIVQQLAWSGAISSGTANVIIGAGSSGYAKGSLAAAGIWLGVWTPAERASVQLQLFGGW